FKNRFEFLYHNNCCLIYNDMANITFKNNLILIDGVLPEITANLLIAYYKDGYSNVVSAIEKITQDNPLGYNLDQGHPFYSYKFKKFLTECALGMLPSKMWNGIVDATGGYIIVKEDGEVLCYHLFNRNEFENYLLKSTRFETASTSRHEFGKIYKENNKYYIKLNLQIRFIK
ncbi:HpaII family restriction endonuclease, partial [Pseudoruminococcus massiliensis]|uniref:HpaII family restriction endonuclease n=1 Tax=Pseudoruminococcus massiliensis TaxID=2086583 RepID=UPI004025CE8A